MSKSTRKYADTEELEYLENKRKELHLTQDNFAELFSMSGDVYRKYINNSRCLDMSIFRMMKIILEYYEDAENYANSISVVDFIESLKTRTLILIFDKQHQYIANLIFDYIINQTKHRFQ